MKKTTLKDIGEKEIIRSIIKPLFNPNDEVGLAGDDCAVINIFGKHFVCLSTDRVPADLISFKLGLIDYFELGYYLAVLNISDVVANGASPVGLLLTFAFNSDFLIEDFQNILHGVKKACDKYGCQVLGGDLSDAVEMSISATSIGTTEGDTVLYRKGAKAGDYIYCSDYVGLTSTAFNYFLKAKPKGFILSEIEEEILANQFRKPKARIELSKRLSKGNFRRTCMDNTDGVGQSFMELSEVNNLKFELQKALLPIHEISFKVAESLKKDILDVVLGGGADFQLVGTHESESELHALNKETHDEITIIGRTREGKGLWIKEGTAESKEYNIPGWDYYSITELLSKIDKR
ncbi:MAG: thiamine-phosphate kinase [Deltaproteobacteria bacterium]|nr:thiamine-phosphate kinase [Deltaproteobacteria bacterium]